MRQPIIGEDIYLNTELYIGHGQDDFHDGLCKINKIEKSSHLPEDHYNYLMIGVEENPRSFYNWRYLLEHQDEWKEEFGDTRGYQDPDKNSFDFDFF